jgi:hypothetical protein
VENNTGISIFPHKTNIWDFESRTAEVVDKKEHTIAKIYRDYILCYVEVFSLLKGSLHFRGLYDVETDNEYGWLIYNSVTRRC